MNLEVAQAMAHDLCQKEEDKARVKYEAFMADFTAKVREKITPEMRELLDLIPKEALWGFYKEGWMDKFMEGFIASSK